MKWVELEEGIQMPPRTVMSFTGTGGPRGEAGGRGGGEDRAEPGFSGRHVGCLGDIHKMSRRSCT